MGKIRDILLRLAHGVDVLLNEADSGISVAVIQTVSLKFHGDLDAFLGHPLGETLYGVRGDFKNMVVRAPRLADQANGDGVDQRIGCCHQLGQIHVDVIEPVDQQIHALEESAAFQTVEGDAPFRVLIHIAGIEHVLVFLPEQGDVMALVHGALFHLLGGIDQVTEAESAVCQVVDLLGELFRHADLVHVLLIEEKAVLVLQQEQAQDHVPPIGSDDRFVRETSPLSYLTDQRRG